MGTWPRCCCEETPEPFPLCTNLDGVPLVLTDANGSHPMVHTGADNYYVNYTYMPAIGSTISTPGGICTKSSVLPASVQYLLNCFAFGGVTSYELSQRFDVSNFPCDGSATHPYRLYQRNDSHPSGASWLAVDAGALVQLPYDAGNPGYISFTFPSSGTIAPFADYYDMPSSWAEISLA
jgi:hypothetical protein